MQFSAVALLAMCAVGSAFVPQTPVRALRQRPVVSGIFDEIKDAFAADDASAIDVDREVSPSPRLNRADGLETISAFCITFARLLLVSLFSGMYKCVVRKRPSSENEQLYYFVS